MQKPAPGKRRVLAQRIMSGTLIVASLILAAKHMPSLGGWLLLVAISAMTQLELYRMLNLPGIPVFRWLGVFVGTGMITSTYVTLGLSADQAIDALAWEHLVLCVGVVAIFFRQFPQRNNTQPLATVACTLLGVFYVAYLFNYITRLVYTWDCGPFDSPVSDTGRGLVLYLVVVVKSSDIGAFFVGSAIGKHKLFPRLSPKKTWEGLAGGLSFSMIASLTYVHMTGRSIGVLKISMVDAAILGLLLALVGIAGDLFESLLKRASGSKDSGATVPGMGGLLDVLDSLLFGAPVLYFYARFILS
ncbi:MAG: CDP-archaeol synthase [Kiritimatiellia bacterium]|jgi:phosphatidate cytidylyltransferase|nr:CDP-archaeol synthase [Kiritimatiellia bacterium]MDP6631429.1 CDP-archaeol synthase [Kiritimatiellia bacterium]MDP6809098.1 CDP-archaeol synthase [Kiritimatiellia bacterium]MDP7023210.1 CDP-archaeol synthase [Kiritimatiellia bacterium]